jgi:hypothetical protein
MRFRDMAVQNYVVRLSAEEPEYLDQLILKGKTPAQRPMKANIIEKPMSANAVKDGATAGRTDVR